MLNRKNVTTQGAGARGYARTSVGEDSPVFRVPTLLEPVANAESMLVFRVSVPA